MVNKYGAKKVTSPEGEVFDSRKEYRRWCELKLLERADKITKLRSFSVPLRPRRCDHFRLRIVGEGDAKIYSISKTIEQGGDL